ncbi:TIGR02281 family clan AA aspartic protease [uncultured Desulfobacter sp.]|uniref:TIGR02281 family clan AA aspartic protease n=1 Tax=uncultured Desulfobacter sp. TaxID=240139 RepID=UPI0029F4B97E|nr:TIGR02281 family clan AA aspartic protease [uncultured Desulfobacter sp.]
MTKKKVNPHRNDNIRICPHCGTENIRIADAWMKITSERNPHLCFNCKKDLYADIDPGYSENGKAEGRNFSIGFFIIAVLLSGLVIWLNRTFNVLTLKEDSGRIVYEIFVILIVSSGLASGKIRQNLKYLAIWAGIILIMMTGYSYRHEMAAIKDKIIAEIIPAKGFRNTPDSISFPVSSDGHFYIRAEVNGIPVTFLADTGASHIVLSPHDAEKLGIKKDNLQFDRFYETANGTVRGSSIRITDFKAGIIHLKEIGASVNEAEMRNSLLGMTFFRRMKGYEVKNDVLTLFWNE